MASSYSHNTTKTTDDDDDTENPDKIYDRIISEAPFLPGDDGTECQVSDIPWANPNLILEGQDFIRRNFFSHALSGVGALLFGFSFKSLTSVLLRTGGFGLGDPAKSLYRHIETSSHTTKWYNTNLCDTESSGFKDIQLVRRMHMKALRYSDKTSLTLLTDDEVPNPREKYQIIKALRNDLKDCVHTKEIPHHLLTYYPTVFLSQFDMIMTQFGFIGILFLFPSTLGICDTRGIDGFMHMWAVIGRLLGIHDRFNIALYPDRRLHMKLFINLAIPSLMYMDLTMLHLQQTFVDAMSSVFKTTTLKSSIYFGLTENKKGLPTFQGENLYALLTWQDKLYCKIKKGVIFLLFHFNWVRHVLNFWYRRVSIRNRNFAFGDKIEQLKILRKQF